MSEQEISTNSYKFMFVNPAVKNDIRTNIEIIKKIKKNKRFI